MPAEALDFLYDVVIYHRETSLYDELQECAPQSLSAPYRRALGRNFQSKIAGMSGRNRRLKEKV